MKIQLFNNLAVVLAVLLGVTVPSIAQISQRRPLATEPTPYTIDQSVWQLEAGILAVSHDRRIPGSAGIKTTTHDYGAMGFRYGLTDQTELQAVFLLHRHREVLPENGNRWTDAGLGDLVVKLKQNLWGNSGGRTAIALLPYVVLPINDHQMSHDRIEGGIATPFVLNIANGFDVTTVGQYDLIRNGDDRGYHSELASVVTFNHPLIGALVAFEEVSYRHSYEAGANQIVTADVGMSLGISDNVQFDCASNFGLTRAADDLTVSVMLTRRF